MATIQVSIPEEIETKIRKVEARFTTRNSAVLYLLNKALETEKGLE